MIINYTKFTEEELEGLSKKDLINLVKHIHIDNLSCDVEFCSTEEGHSFSQVNEEFVKVAKKINKEI